jgi:hypothetical protein
VLHAFHRAHEGCGPLYGPEVDVHSVLGLPGVAAGHRQGYRDAAFAAALEDEAVAFGETLLADREPSEPVVFVCVCACEVDREFCSRSVESPFEPVFERFEELAVVGTVGEGDIQVALLFVEREVFGAVDREREDRRVLAQDRRRPVPLVHVGVHDDDPLDEPCGPHRPGGDGAVVEHTVAFAPAGEGMVRAARQVCSETVLEGSEACAQCSTLGPSRALDHPHLPREPDAPHLLLGEGPVDDATEVTPLVGAQDLFVGDRAGHPHLAGAADV